MAEPNLIESWIEAAQRGDRLALAKVLTAYHPRLRARAAAQMDAALAARSGPDDVLQEVYLDVARQIGRFENRGSDSFLSWMYAILNHKLVDVRRAVHAQARDPQREVAAYGGSADSYWSLLDRVYAESGTPSRVARREEALGALSSSISNLSELHRRVIQLRFLEGLSVDEVAARLGKSAAAVVALSKRALAALRANMDRQGEFTRGG